MVLTFLSKGVKYVKDFSWAFYYIPFIYMPVLMLVFHYFDYCHFVGSFEVVSLTSLSPFFFFFDTVLTLAIPCEFFKFIF